MATLSISLDDEVERRLRHRAARRGRSLEAEITEILRMAAESEGSSAGDSQIAALFRGLGLDREMPELRGYSVVPVAFEE